MAERRSDRQQPDPARSAAYDVLAAVRERDAYANLALTQVLRERALDGRDAGFATALVSDTLRRQGTYDAVLARCVTGGLARLDPGVLDVLRLGTHQLLSMRVPTHAAVGTSVELTRHRVGHGPAGLVNAVLRRVAGHDLDGWLRRVAPDPVSDPVGFAAVVHSHPRWVVEQLGAALAAVRGAERPEELQQLLAADNAAPQVTLAAWPGRATPEELLASGGRRGRWSPYAVVGPDVVPGEIAAVREGRAGVQDEGSQLVALALAAATVVGPDQKWLDLCAGPGGKAALLAGLGSQRGARVLAAERQPHRAALVRRALAGSPGGLGTVVADGTRPAWPAARLDRVLVDAPCSGLGALRRRPEARWRRTPADIEELVPLQRALLSAGLEAVRPGGVVLYATCTPVIAETAGVVAGVLDRHPEATLEDASALVPSLLEGTGDGPETTGPMPGTVQLWPHAHGTDAMFWALLRRH